MALSFNPQSIPSGAKRINIHGMRRAMMLLASTVLMQTAPAHTIALRIRVFDGTDEVTAQTRIVVFKAGDRQSPLAAPGGAVNVAPGFYDAQIIREQDGKVTGIRWAERLVVEAYPDEAGRHLDVVNLQNGYGALEVRSSSGSVPDAALFAKDAHDTAVARRIDGDGYALFVVPTGVYDVRVTENGQTRWHLAIEVPADRTRFVLANSTNERRHTFRPLSSRNTTMMMAATNSR